MIIAIDGPAASGKGTLAKLLARHYRLPHLDTGALYRAVAMALIDAGKPLDNPDAAEQAALNLDTRLIDDPRIRAAGMGEPASKVAAMPGVRKALLEFQRRFANQPGGAVLDGRDIGTVICPAAGVKLFVTASAEIRAGRRHREAVSKGEAAGFDAVLADILKRDERDSARSSAPLVMAKDACLLDTSDMDIEAAFQAALAAVDKRLGR